MQEKTEHRGIVVNGYSGPPLLRLPLKNQTGMVLSRRVVLHQGFTYMETKKGEVAEKVVIKKGWSLIKGYTVVCLSLIHI